MSSADLRGDTGRSSGVSIKDGNENLGRAAASLVSALALVKLMGSNLEGSGT